MRAHVAEGLDAGALGFSTGLSMAPGFYSLGSEVLALNLCEGYCNGAALGHEEIWHAHRW